MVCLRRRVEHPQLLGTSRHVTCGGPDLRSVSWQGNTLSGESELVAGDPYVLYLTEPDGYRLDGIEVTGTRVVGQGRAGAVRTIQLASAAGGVAQWRMTYRAQE